MGSALIVIVGCSLSAQGKYGGGSGTPEDPYQIRDANHMQAIGAGKISIELNERD